MVKRFKRKPEIVHAVQWDGTNPEEVKSFCGVYAEYLEDENEVYLIAHGGKHFVSIGDYIVENESGEFLPERQDVVKNEFEEI